MKFSKAPKTPKKKYTYGARVSRSAGKSLALNFNYSAISAYGILFMLTIGVLAGAIFSNLVDSVAYDSIKGFMSEFLNGFDKDMINQKATFLESLFKYARLVLIIWISGFFAPGAVIIFCAVLSKAFAYGFTTAALVKYFGVYGFIIGFSAYFPQNLIFLPGIFYLAYNALGMIQDRKSDAPSRMPSAKKGGALYTEYALVLLIGLLCCAIAALTETYLTPMLLEYVKPV